MGDWCRNFYLLQWPKKLTFFVVFIDICASCLMGQAGDNASADITKSIFAAWQLTTPTHPPNIPPLSHVNLEPPVPLYPAAITRSACARSAATVSSLRGASLKPLLMPNLTTALQQKRRYDSHGKIICPLCGFAALCHVLHRCCRC